MSFTNWQATKIQPFAKTVRPGDPGTLRAAYQLTSSMTNPARHPATALDFVFEAVPVPPLPPTPAFTPPPTLFSSAQAQAATARSQALGIDIRCLVDLDPYFSLLYGQDCLAQDLVHRFATLRGQLFYDEDYGRAIYQLLNEGFSLTSTSTISLIAKNLEAEALKDERVDTCVVDLEFLPNASPPQINATIAIGSAVGVFTLIVGITSLSVSLIQVQ